MADKDAIYKCEQCGNVVYVLESGASDLVCCGENMKKLTGEELEPYEKNIMKPGSP